MVRKELLITNKKGDDGKGHETMKKTIQKVLTFLLIATTKGTCFISIGSYSKNGLISSGENTDDYYIIDK